MLNVPYESVRRHMVCPVINIFRYVLTIQFLDVGEYRPLLDVRDARS